MVLSLCGCKFFEVDAGRFYRGPQPTASELETAITQYGLKTVINLRGEHSGRGWYDDEKAVTERLGINFISIGMSATRLPHRGDLIKLLDAFQNAPRPLFVHCRAGVDRTGEASALYQMLYMGKTRDEALEMLTPQFGHFEALMPAKRYFVRDVWQGEEWARKDYNPCLGQYEYYDPNDFYCRDGIAAPLTEDEDT